MAAFTASVAVRTPGMVGRNATSIVQLALPASAIPVQRSEVTRYCEESAPESVRVIVLLVAEPKLVTVNVVGGVLVPSKTVP